VEGVALCVQPVAGVPDEDNVVPVPEGDVLKALTGGANKKRRRAGEPAVK
jgi:hypothetical protein